MKINYEQIEQDYPKAYGMFKQSKYYRVSEQGYHLFDDRDLYDFFDEHELYVEVFRGDKNWFFEAYNKDFVASDYSEKHKSRTEAEACAFNAAFKLLEETLSNWTSADNLKREFGV